MSRGAAPLAALAWLLGTSGCKPPATAISGGVQRAVEAQTATFTSSATSTAGEAPTTTGTATATVAPETAAQLLQDCGVANIDLTNPSTPLLSESLLASQTIDQTGSQAIPLLSSLLPSLGTVNYTVHVLPKLSIQATVGQAVDSTTFTITADVTPSFAESQVISTAQQTVGPQVGSTTSVGMSTSDRLQLASSNAAWQNIICVVEPTTSITQAYGSTTKTITFSPALPIGISPRADATRYNIEVPATRTFGGITATVTQSTDPAMPQGTVVQGQVTIQPLTQTTVQAPGAGPISADAAFEIDTDFGASTAALGLKATTQFYIDSTNKNFKALVTSTTDPTAPTVTLLPQ